MSQGAHADVDEAAVESDNGWQEETCLDGQLKEIIEALSDIRSQLAEQNKYLDVLTEKYIVKPRPQITFMEEEWESERESDKESEDLEWEGSVESVQESESESFPDDPAWYTASVNERPSAQGWSTETTQAGRAENNRYVLGFTAATVFYLPLGLMTSFGVRLFNSNGDTNASQIPFIPIFLILSLMTHIFVACALWLIRDGDRMKNILGSWRLTWANQSSQNPLKAGRFPNLLRRRKA